VIVGVTGIFEYQKYTISVDICHLIVIVWIAELCDPSAWCKIVTNM